MPQTAEADVPADPADVGLLGPPAVLMQPNSLPYLGQELGRTTLRFGLPTLQRLYSRERPEKRSQVPFRPIRGTNGSRWLNPVRRSQNPVLRIPVRSARPVIGPVRSPLRSVSRVFRFDKSTRLLVSAAFTSDNRPSGTVRGTSGDNVTRSSAEVGLTRMSEAAVGV
jgi:hypothetical protein